MCVRVLLQMAKEAYHYVSLGEFNGFVCELLSVTSGDTDVALVDFLARLHCVEFTAEDPLKEFFYQPHTGEGSGADGEEKQDDS
jgi:hypothetical protein